MNERAIVATDLSDASLCMVEHLSLLNSLQITSIVLLQCPDYQEIASEVFPYIISIQQEMLERQRDILISLGFKVEVVVLPGNTASVIRQIARDKNIHLVVVGSMGQSLIKGAFLGGVAQEIMRHTVTPLLIVRIFLNEEGLLCISHKGLLNHVVLCVDFSSSFSSVFESFLLHMSGGLSKRITLIHVVDESHLDEKRKEKLEDLITISKQRLSVMEQKVRSIGVSDVTSLILHGSIHVEIANFIHHDESSLVVLGTHGASFFKEIFASCPSLYIGRHSPKSVLLLPQN